MDFWINGMMGRQDRWFEKLSGLNVLRCFPWNAPRNQNCPVNLLRPPAKMLRPVLRPFAQKTSVKQYLLRRYDLPGGSPLSRTSPALKSQGPSSKVSMKETKPGQFASQSPVLTRLSAVQRHPNACQSPVATPPISTQLTPISGIALLIAANPFHRKRRRTVHQSIGNIAPVSVSRSFSILTQ
jgi:hypothetical protein